MASRGNKFNNSADYQLINLVYFVFSKW